MKGIESRLGLMQMVNYHRQLPRKMKFLLMKWLK